MVVCRECGNSVPPRYRFCTECGAALSSDTSKSSQTQVCGSCGKQTKAGLNFCTNCGVRLAEDQTQTRRLTGIGSNLGLKGFRLLRPGGGGGGQNPGAAPSESAPGGDPRLAENYERSRFPAVPAAQLSVRLQLRSPHRAVAVLYALSDIHSTNDAHNTEIDRTEVIQKAACNSTFSRLLLLPLSHTEQFKIAIYSAKDDCSFKPEDCIGEVCSSLSQLDRPGTSLSCSLVPCNSREPTGSLVLCYESTLEPVGGDYRPGDCVRTYVFLSENRKVFVQEELRESATAFDLTHSTLALLLPERRTQLAHLQQQISGKEKRWHSLVEEFRTHIGLMTGALENYSSRNRAALGVTFRPSTCKNDPKLVFLPTNLHCQHMAVFYPSRNIPEAVYSTVTVGVPAAHYYKLKRGLRQLKQQQDKMSLDSKDPFEITSSAMHITMRSDVVLPQMLCALVDSFTCEVYRHTLAQNRTFFEQLRGVGFLIQVESLLSTYGKEMAMLGDLDWVVQSITSVSLRLLAPEGDSNASLSVGRGAERDSWIVTVPFPAEAVALMDSVPLDVAVKPVLFTQGINEEQTLANRLGESVLQEEINAENFVRLEQYFWEFLGYFSERLPSERRPWLQGLNVELHDVGLIIRNSKREKNVMILARMADFCRQLNAGRVTMCKSAKDRSSMSVTWEQARLLSHHHGINNLDHVISVMRTSGVRRSNVMKNTGSDRFAFNSLQLQLMPEVYRAPKGSTSRYASR